MQGELLEMVLDQAVSISFKLLGPKSFHSMKELPLHECGFYFLWNFGAPSDL